MTRQSCDGCIYRFQANTEDSLCNYLCTTGKQRGCSAQHCDKKVVRHRSRPKPIWASERAQKEFCGNL